MFHVEMILVHLDKQIDQLKEQLKTGKMIESVTTLDQITLFQNSANKLMSFVPDDKEEKPKPMMYG